MGFFDPHPLLNDFRSTQMGAVSVISLRKRRDRKRNLKKAFSDDNKKNSCSNPLNYQFQTDGCRNGPRPKRPL